MDSVDKRWLNGVGRVVILDAQTRHDKALGLQSHRDTPPE